MYRTNKFNYFTDEWRHTKIFYVSVIVQSFLRMTTYALLTFAVPQSDRDNIWISVMRSIPDTLFYINYLLLVYQALNIFYHSHMENRASVSLLVHFSRRKFGRARKYIAVLIIAWLGFMGTMYALLVTEKVRVQIIDVEFTVMNLASPTLVLTYLMYMYSKYSETPLKSEGDRVNVHHISWVLLIWTLGTYFKGFLGLQNLKSASLLEYLSNPQNSTLGGALLFVAQSLVSEIFCYLLVMDRRFVNIFVTQDQKNMTKGPENFLSELSIDSLESN
jgi:hypothetical protein